MNVSSLNLLRCLFLPTLMLAFVARGAPDSDPLGAGEKAASDWIKVRLETSRLETAWTSERPLLESTVNGLKDHAQTLEEKRDLLISQTAKDRTEIATMQGKNKESADDLHATEVRLQALVEKLNDLRAYLPPRLSESLEMSFRSLRNAGLGAGERMQLAMTTLNRCLQFNRNVSCGEEVLSIDAEDGSKSLEVIYWGLSHGYALDRKAGKVWYGSPGPKGWKWDPLPGALDPITKLVGIYNDKVDPDFVSVPATLGQPVPEAVAK